MKESQFTTTAVALGAVAVIMNGPISSAISTIGPDLIPSAPTSSTSLSWKLGFLFFKDLAATLLRSRMPYISPSSIMHSVSIKVSGPDSSPVFHLSTSAFSYIFHVNEEGDLVLDHYGAPATAATPEPDTDVVGWMRVQRRREFPDVGRGDMRLPAIHVSHTGSGGHTVSAFAYRSHTIIDGKPPLPGLPATFGNSSVVKTLQVTMVDKYSDVEAVLSYSVFGCGALARSWALTNKGSADITLERAASICVDFPSDDLEFIHHYGNWARECMTVRRKVEQGTQGFQSLAGYASHHYNPFFALVRPGTTERTGEAWGFNLVYSGSFSAEIERCFRGYTRALIGLNPMHLSWKLVPGETFTAPECVTVYSPHGLGGMSRAFHKVYRNHLSRSEHTLQTRPTLLNNWEATYFDMDENRLFPIAQTAAELGVKMFVMDDGWFGSTHPRVNDSAGLGDWVVNKDRFKHGLKPFVERITALKAGDKNMKFGIWVEPEMVNPVSALYEAHPDWVLHAADLPRSEGRNQLVLNLGLKVVQDYIIDAIGAVLASADISYVKWDNNRAMHELAHPSDAHKYMLGIYRVIDSLTTRFPHVLWEGCASGGGRFDPGLLHYWPQHWTSDNTDAHDRLYIQFGTSLSYPASSMGCHVSAVPNHQTQRITPFSFRAHVAMMGGSFGFELDINKLSDDDKAQIPGLIALSEEISPLVITGEMYRLATPWESNWPAVQYVAQDGSKSFVLLYQVRDAVIHNQMPPVRLDGLDSQAWYEVDDRRVSGDELMQVGLTYRMRGDFQSKVIRVTRL